MAYFRVHAGSERRALHVNHPTMSWILRFGLLIVGQCVCLWAHCQNTFEKLLPDLQPTWGDCCRRSPSGGLTICFEAGDHSGPSGSDIALVSFNDQGDTLWTRTYGRSFDETCFHLLVTIDGGYLLTGSTTTSATDFPPENIYLIRTDSVGDTLWTRSYAHFIRNTGWSAFECDDGGFVVVGSSDQWINYGGLYIIKIDTQGNLLWSKFYDYFFPPDFESTVSVRCATQASNGDFFVAGSLIGSSEAFLAKFDSDGNLLWARETDSIQYIEQLESTPDGGLIISGSYNANPLLVRLDSVGLPIWSKAYDGVAYGGVIASIQTSDGGLAVVAQTIDWAPESSDVYFLKTDSEGEVLFSRTFGDTLWDAGRGIVEADDGGYFIVAFTTSFGFGFPMAVIKTHSSGNTDCHQHNDTTVAVDVQLTWDTMELQLYPSVTEQYPSACSIRSGTTVLDLCSVGVNEASPSSIAIHVFPNPTRGGFIVSIASGHAGSEIGVFNALGERVYSAKVLQPETRIDLTPFPRGMYLVKVSTGRSAVVEKVVLE